MLTRRPFLWLGAALIGVLPAVASANSYGRGGYSLSFRYERPSYRHYDRYPDRHRHHYHQHHYRYVPRYHHAPRYYAPRAHHYYHAPAYRHYPRYNYYRGHCW